MRIWDQVYPEKPKSGKDYRDRILSRNNGNYKISGENINEIDENHIGTSFSEKNQPLMYNRWRP